jgi:hypothetical protein
MCRRRHCLPPAGAWALLLLGCSAAARAEAPPAGSAVPLAVHDGRCECVLPTEPPDAKYYVILGSLARDAGPYRVQVRTEQVDDPVSVPVQNLAADPAWVRRTAQVHERLARARRDQAGPPSYPGAADPPRRRTFYLFVGDDKFQDPAGYAEVRGDLQAAGRHCQVYLDHDHPDPAALAPTVADIVRTFDEDVFPRAARVFGHAADVDRDGRFTVLLTGWLGKLQAGRVSLGGFVRGSDFYPDLAAPFGNRCDMMYLNTNLRPGPHLRSLLAHEYTHAVVFSEHVFGDYLPGPRREDEEAWLNEGLAHLAEDLHGYGWSNLDYRVSAFLGAPERYQLVVPDYYAAGLWRTPGSRGATYLFLRWCLGRHGDGLPGELVQSNLHGIDNLEAATREPFDELFRQWSAALLLAGSNLGSETAPPFGPRLDPRRPLAGRLLAGPRFAEVAFGGTSHEVRLAGTSAAYLLLHCPAGPRTRLTVTAEAGAELQVSLVRCPDGTARLALRREPGDRLRLTAHDAAVTLDEAAWERLRPAGERPDETSYWEPGAPGKGAVEDWFGNPHLEAGESRLSPPLDLPSGAGDLVFKVTATDAAGHRVTGWDGPNP